ncbi:hypothetical protein D3C86_1815940 [compost metagenome]
MIWRGNPLGQGLVQALLGLVAGGGQIMTMIAGEILRVILDEVGAIDGVVVLAHGEQTDEGGRHPADHSKRK